MRRTDLMDTKEWAHRRVVLGLREKSPEWRLHRTLGMCAAWNVVMSRRDPKWQKIAEARRAAYR